MRPEMSRTIGATGVPNPALSVLPRRERRLGDDGNNRSRDQGPVLGDIHGDHRPNIHDVLRSLTGPSL